MTGLQCSPFGRRPRSDSTSTWQSVMAPVVGAISSTNAGGAVEGSNGSCQAIRLESNCRSFATELQPAEEAHGGRVRFRQAKEAGTRAGNRPREGRRFRNSSNRRCNAVTVPGRSLRPNLPRSSLPPPPQTDPIREPGRQSRTFTETSRTPERGTQGKTISALSIPRFLRYRDIDSCDRNQIVQMRAVHQKNAFPKKNNFAFNSTPREQGCWVAARPVRKVRRARTRWVVSLCGSRIELQHSAETLSRIDRLRCADLAELVDEAIPSP